MCFIIYLQPTPSPPCLVLIYQAWNIFPGLQVWSAINCVLGSWRECESCPRLVSGPVLCLCCSGPALPATSVWVVWCFGSPATCFWLSLLFSIWRWRCLGCGSFPKPGSSCPMMVKYTPGSRPSGALSLVARWERSTLVLFLYLPF